MKRAQAEPLVPGIPAAVVVAGVLVAVPVCLFPVFLVVPDVAVVLFVPVDDAAAAAESAAVQTACLLEST